ncbi:MAG: sensor histidine kinase [Leptospirales bacterium]|nr:sensor histidine kinase [Leptospirales bacterium]
MTLRYLIVLLLVQVLVSSLAAREITVTDALTLTGSDMEILQDAGAALTIEDIVKPEKRALFQADPRPTPYFGFTNAHIWVKLDVKSVGERSNWFIEVREPLLHNIELYSVAQNGKIERQSAGRLRPFDEREVKHRKILFPIVLEQTTSTFYLKFQSRDYLSVPLKLWPRREFFMAELGDQLILGLFYGIVAALFLYNLFLFISLKDINYLYYILYLGCFSLFQTAIDGLFFQVVTFSPPWLSWRIPLFSALASGVFLLMFAHSFLALESAPRIVSYARTALLIAIAAFAILSLRDNTMWFATQYANIASLLTMLFAIGVGIYRTVRGYRPSRYFLAGWLVFLSGGMAASLVNLGILPPNVLTRYWMKFGFIAELLLFSFALGDRVTLLKAAKEEADKQALETQQRMAADLENQVRERTSELREANATKDKFFSIIAHDLRGPIGSLAALFTEVIEDDGKLESSLLGIIRKTTVSTQQLLESLLTWSRSQLGEIEFRPEIIKVDAVARETMALVEAQARAKGIKLSLKSDGRLAARADASMTSLILRNLLGNAIKFTGDGGSISVEIKEINESIEISVSDTGTGMPEEKARSLFRAGVKNSSTPGTNAEMGSGLGLILCREFTERNGGTIGAESTPGKGSRFWFTLPAAENKAEANLVREAL